MRKRKIHIRIGMGLGIGCMGFVLESKKKLHLYVSDSFIQRGKTNKNSLKINPIFTVHFIMVR
jgi:hypothetical protein